jgi:hypothetical protein
VPRIVVVTIYSPKVRSQEEGLLSEVMRRVVSTIDLASLGIVYTIRKV